CSSWGGIIRESSNIQDPRSKVKKVSVAGTWNLELGSWTLPNKLPDSTVLLVEQEDAIVRSHAEAQVGAFRGRPFLSGVLVFDELQQGPGGLPLSAVEQHAPHGVLPAGR